MLLLGEPWHSYKILVMCSSENVLAYHRKEIFVPKEVCEFGPQWDFLSLSHGFGERTIFCLTSLGFVPLIIKSKIAQSKQTVASIQLHKKCRNS